MTRGIRWSDEATGRTIARSTNPSDATLDLLCSTIWGSKASRYRILGLPEKLKRLRDPSYFTLLENDKELGVIVIDHCTKDISGKSCDAFHFVMAATEPARRKEGLAGVILDEVRKYCFETVGEPGIGFAYVEATTEFSLRLSDRIGHTLEAEIPLVLYTRLWPKTSSSVHNLPPEAADEMIKRLQDLYADHELADFERSFRADEYYVLRNGGKVVAGLQAEVIRWSVAEMPGLIGWFLVSVFPNIPFSKNIIDLRDLRIVRLGNLYNQPGDERRLAELMEAVLARHKSKVGLIMIDGRSPMLKRIKDYDRLGVLSSALKGSVKIRIDIAGMDEETLESLSSSPLLVSPADVI
ncbi:MAG: hypothetical protein QNJ35_07015 [Paracoccaceae bacterium]|nr:hypothetical protein [Paracoccaceae bacterium]